MSLKKFKICPTCNTKNPTNQFECKKEGCGTDLTGVKIVNETPNGGGNRGDNNNGLVKFCPTCNTKNPTDQFECKKEGCGTDLTGVKIVNETPNEDGNRGDNSNGLVKQCYCGTVNFPQARKCSACGEDISPIRPAPLQPIDTPTQFFLRTADGEYSFALAKELTIIGRSAEMSDYLSTKSYVSRKHATFTVVGKDVYVCNKSTTNPTFVNNLKIPSDVPTLLKNGDEIGIGGKLINGNRQNEAAYFIFEVGS